MKQAFFACAVCCVVVCGCSITSLLSSAPLPCDDDASCPPVHVCGEDGFCVVDDGGEGEGEAAGEGEGEGEGEEGEGEGEGEGEEGEGEGEGSRCGTPLEQCDDDNVEDGDGCDNNCTFTGCGNGVITPLEACDDNNGVDGDGCDSNCTLTGCGNGVITAGELCDDGNADGDDGCTDCAPDCDDDFDCDDDVFCNGVEVCDDDRCVDGERPCVSEGFSCDEELDVCDGSCEPIFFDDFDVVDGVFSHPFADAPQAQTLLTDDGDTFVDVSAGDEAYAGTLYEGILDVRGQVLEAHFHVFDADENEEHLIALNSDELTFLVFVNGFGGTTNAGILVRARDTFAIVDIDAFEVPAGEDSFDVQVRFDNPVTAVINGNALSLGEAYSQIFVDTELAFATGCFDTCDGIDALLEHAGLYEQCREPPGTGS